MAARARPYYRFKIICTYYHTFIGEVWVRSRLRKVVHCLIVCVYLMFPSIVFV